MFGDWRQETREQGPVLGGAGLYERNGRGQKPRPLALRVAILGWGRMERGLGPVLNLLRGG